MNNSTPTISTCHNEIVDAAGIVRCLSEFVDGGPASNALSLSISATAGLASILDNLHNSLWKIADTLEEIEANARAQEGGGHERD